MPTAPTSSEADNSSLYAILNIPRDASIEDIRRSYRQLASTLHPDKAPDPALHSDASREFNRIQEAYEILSDPSKRDIYDVYGSEGLAAGMELSGPFTAREDLKKEWDAFREKQKREEVEASLNYRGTYVFRTDATALVNPYARHISRTPQLTNVYMMNGLDIPIDSSKYWGMLGSEQDVLHFGGLVSVRDSVGGGSFIAGYRRAYSDYTQVGLEASVGLRTLFSAQTSFQISQNSSATLVGSWNPKSGAGLQFITTRQLDEKTSGEYSWTLGPEEARGMALSVTHRREKTVFVARIEVGAATAFILRIIRQISDVLTGRIQLKLGFSGVELDVGATKRFSEVNTGGLSVVVGLQGVLLRARMSRAGHTFEFPILLSSTLVPRVIMGAYFLPPFAFYIAKEWVFIPLSKHIEAQKAFTERQKQSDVIHESLQHAAKAAALMAPVARRKMRREAVASGLVVVFAIYGEETAVKSISKQILAAKAAIACIGHTEENLVVGAESSGEQKSNHIINSNTNIISDNNDTSAAAAAPSSSPLMNEEEEIKTPKDRDNQDQPIIIPAHVDVTTAVQYLCDSSRIIFHPGYHKSSLMGFCDPAPATTKILLVYYSYQGRPFVATFGEIEGGQLPARGTRVDDSEEASLVLKIAHSLSSD